MYISSLSLREFRNYESLDLTLDKGTNIFYGDNAQGKTNILEGIYLCGTTRSYRGAKDKELIRFGENEAHIRMILHKEEMPYRLDMHLRKNLSKGIAINGMPIRKAKELLGIASLVFFSPEDLNIIKSGPSERRRFIDAQLCQLDKVYLTELTEYNKIVVNRNKLLKDISFQPGLLSTLDVWDAQLLRYGKNIIEKRASFTEELQGIASDVHRDITNGKENLVVVYEPNISSEGMEKALLNAREKDRAYKNTSIGPHRDDLKVMANEIDIRKYGSQGQQRTAALSLKLSELYMLKKKSHENPILLLDDVLSELDTGRQNCLLDTIHDIQTLITCTGLEDFVNHRFTLNKVFQVINGNVFEKESR